MAVPDPLLDPTAPRSLLGPTLVVLAALLAFDASGLDMPLARVFGSGAGFALKDDWWLETVFHRGGRLVAWGFALWVCLGVWWPVGPLRRLDTRGRVWLAVTMLLALSAVASLKSISTTSCPWDMAAFGRGARLVSHWHRDGGRGDGGSGRCFPAGHASGGFAFIAGFFAFRRVSPVIARRWLLASVAGGTVLGLVQQARGAHFMSHTLWTGAICWAVALTADTLWQRRYAGRTALP